LPRPTSAFRCHHRLQPCIAGVATASLSMNLYSVAQMFAGRAPRTWIGIRALSATSGILGPIISE
jgi:hypothetical protein